MTIAESILNFFRGNTTSAKSKNPSNEDPRSGSYVKNISLEQCSIDYKDGESKEVVAHKISEENGTFEIRYIANIDSEDGVEGLADPDSSVAFESMYIPSELLASPIEMTFVGVMKVSFDESNTIDGLESKVDPSATEYQKFSETKSMTNDPEYIEFQFWDMDSVGNGIIDLNNMGDGNEQSE